MNIGLLYSLLEALVHSPILPVVLKLETFQIVTYLPLADLEYMHFWGQGQEEPPPPLMNSWETYLYSTGGLNIQTNVTLSNIYCSNNFAMLSIHKGKAEFEIVLQRWRCMYLGKSQFQQFQGYKR